MTPAVISVPTIGMMKIGIPSAELYALEFSSGNAPRCRHNPGDQRTKEARAKAVTNPGPIAHGASAERSAME